MLRLLCVILTICLAFAPSGARAGGITLINSDSGGPYGEFTSTLNTTLAGSNWQVNTILEADKLNAPLQKSDLIVTTGVTALRQALQFHSGTPIFAALIPRQSYDKTLAETAGRSAIRISAIWLDQPPSRQAMFIRQLLPAQKRIGVLAGAESRQQLATFRPPFSGAGLTLDAEDSDSENSLLPSLNALLQRNGVLLALPDGQIYRRENIKPILITTYRLQKPVIAFSPAFVTAGALGALYSTPSQIARQTAEAILANGNNLGPATYPVQFAISINFNVAQALNLNIPDESTVRQNMLGSREAR